MIQVTPEIAIGEDEIEEHFIRAPGPGGQKVNKTASAVQLRFDAQNSPALSAPVFHRLKQLAGRRMTRDGVVVITANRFRAQERNRADALDRLVDLIRLAAVRPVHRRPTRPTKASRRRQSEQKRHQSARKRARARVRPPD